MPLVKTNTALARALGVDEKAVRLAEAAGRITREQDKRWDVEKVRREWSENTNAGKRHRGGPKGEDREETGQGQANGSSHGRWQQARTARESIQARLLEIELKRKTGEVVDAAVVEREAFETARKLRDLILALPGRVAPLVAGMTPAEARKVLDEECGRICDEMSGFRKGGAR